MKPHQNPESWVIGNEEVSGIEPGEWIAIVDHKVVAHSFTLLECIAEAKEKGYDNPVITALPEHPDMPLFYQNEMPKPLTPQTIYVAAGVSESGLTLFGSFSTRDLAVQAVREGIKTRLPEFAFTEEDVSDDLDVPAHYEFRIYSGL